MQVFQALYGVLSTFDRYVGRQVMNSQADMVCDKMSEYVNVIPTIFEMDTNGP